MQDTSLPSILMLGSLATLVNQSLRLVDGSYEQLTRLDGCVVRFRLENPSLAIYLLLHKDGVEFLDQYEGDVDVRVRAPLGALLQYLLLPDNSNTDSIRVQGDDATLAKLANLLDYGSFWAIARGWLDHSVRFNELLNLLNREDPAWLTRLEGLPKEVQALANQLARQQLLLGDILDEMRQLQTQLNQQRRMDIFCMIGGLFFLFAALASQSGNLPHYILHQTVIFASMGGALLLSRLIVTGKTKRFLTES